MFAYSLVSSSAYWRVIVLKKLGRSSSTLMLLDCRVKPHRISFALNKWVKTSKMMLERSISRIGVPLLILATPVTLCPDRMLYSTVSMKKYSLLNICLFSSIQYAFINIKIGDHRSISIQLTVWDSSYKGGRRIWYTIAILSQTYELKKLNAILTKFQESFTNENDYTFWIR